MLPQSQSYLPIVVKIVNPVKIVIAEEPPQPQFRNFCGSPTHLEFRIQNYKTTIADRMVLITINAKPCEQDSSQTGIPLFYFFIDLVLLHLFINYSKIVKILR